MTVASCSSPPPSASDRIVSTNPCLDAILVDIAPERIAALSHWSHDPRASSIPQAVARRFPATQGTAEEVIALRPGLVLASSFTSPATLAAYRRLGLKVERFGIPSTLGENRAQIRAVARAAGVPARGEALIARIDRAVAEAAPRDARRPTTLLWLGGSNLVTGHGTLIDEMMTRAGLSNASAGYGLRFTGVLPLEHVVARPPALVLTPAAEPGESGEARRTALRLRALPRTARIGRFPPDLFFCGGPSVIPAMRRLAEVRAEALR